MRFLSTRAKRGNQVRRTSVRLAFDWLEDRDCPSGLAPIAVNDTFSQLVGGDLTGNVLANDSDPENDPLTAVLASTPQHGTLQFFSDGSMFYTPNAGFLGTDSFSYFADDGTNQSLATVTLEVNLTASPRMVVPGSEGTLLDEQVATFSVTDSTLTAEQFTATIAWGDGNSSAGTIVKLGPTDYEVRGSHIYVEDGSYDILVTINDPAGNDVSVTSGGSIVNVAPQNVSAGGNRTADEGDIVTFTGTFTDPGTLDTHTLTWSVKQNGVEIASGSGQQFSFMPDDDGIYDVTLTVTDDEGAFGTDTVTLTAANVAPTLGINGASSVDELAFYTLNLSASDPGNDTITEWRIDWGDGGGIETIAGNPSSVTHIFDAPGTYTITAQAVDEDGVWSAGNSQQVTVNNVAPVLDFNHTMLNQKWVKIDGNVIDGNPGNLTVTFTGVITTTAVTDATGHFSVTVEASALGDYTGTVTDAGGLQSIPITKTLTSNVPWISSFSATRIEGDMWVFQGTVVDESPEGLVVELSGIPSLQGVTATVLSDGSFSVVIELDPGESGTVSAITTDWWGLTSNIAQDWVDNSY